MLRLRRTGSKESNFSARGGSNESNLRRTGSQESHFSARAGSNVCAVESPGVLKAFILISGADGVSEVDLRKALLKVRKPEVCRMLETNLHEVFSSCNAKGDGALDLDEFDQMIKGSSLMEEAIHDFLTVCEGIDEDSLNPLKSLEGLGLALTVLNTGTMALSADYSPNWFGWHIIEACFVAAFSIEILARIYRCAKHCEALQVHDQGGRAFIMNGVWKFLQEPLNFLDVVITLLAAVDLIFVFYEVESSSLSLFTLLRMLRLVRLGRLVKIIYAFVGLSSLVQGIMSGLNLVGWSFVLIDLVATMWAIIFRSLASGPLDAEGKLAERFPTIYDSIGIVYRCTVLRADCVDSSGVSIFELLSEHFGVFGTFPWFCTEIFVFFGVLNAVASVYVVQAMKNDEDNVQRKINLISRQKDSDRLNELDRLVNGLTQAYRKRQAKQQHANPQAQNVDKVAKYLQREYPLAALELPDVTETVMKYSQSIEDSKAQYQDLLDNYDTEQRLTLLDIPSATTYSVYQDNHQVEKLLVDKRHSSAQKPLGIVNLGIETAPDGAAEVPLIQKQVRVHKLMKEAAKVQEHVKHIIWPHSEWAKTSRGGRTDECIWRETRHLCDEAFDPGIKSARRIRQKLQMKCGGRCESNHDYCRLGLIYYSVDHLLKGLMKLLEYSADGPEGIQVIRIENHFIAPTPLGWRDVMVLLKVRVPSRSALAGTSYHLMELQMQLKDFVEVLDQAHEYQKKIRGPFPEEAVDAILDRLAVNDTAAPLVITKEEWLQCIQNNKVQSLLDSLGVKGHLQKDVIDIVDANGSGTVSSEELHQGLLMCVCRGLPQAHDLMDCRLKMREVQQLLHHHLEPQMHILRDMLKYLNCTPQDVVTWPKNTKLCHSEAQEKKLDAEVTTFKDAKPNIPTPRFIAGNMTKIKGPPTQTSLHSPGDNIIDSSVNVNVNVNVNAGLSLPSPVSLSTEDAKTVRHSGDISLPSTILVGANHARSHVRDEDVQIVQINKEARLPSSLSVAADHTSSTTKNHGGQMEINLLQKELQDLNRTLMEKTNCLSEKDAELSEKDAEIVQLKGKVKVLPETLQCLQKTMEFHEQFYHSISRNPPQSQCLLDDESTTCQTPKTPKTPQLLKEYATLSM